MSQPPSSASSSLRHAAYADLPQVAEAHSHASLMAQLELARQENDHLRSQLSALTQRTRVLTKQRDVLLHNLCALLKTARREATRRFEK